MEIGPFTISIPQIESRYIVSREIRTSRCSSEMENIEFRNFQIKNDLFEFRSFLDAFEKEMLKFSIWKRVANSLESV